LYLQLLQSSHSSTSSVRPYLLSRIMLYIHYTRQK